jgi:DNA-binding SARP family transcriptional activator
MNRALAKPRLRILGPIEAWSDDRWLDLGGPRQVALLAYLLVHANQAVPSDVLLEALWGPTPCGADNRLQMAVARLRKSLSPLNGSAGLVLRTVGGGYLLSLGPSQLDPELFTARVRDGLRAAQKEEPQSAGGSRTHRRNRTRQNPPSPDHLPDGDRRSRRAAAWPIGSTASGRPGRATARPALDQK